MTEKKQDKLFDRFYLPEDVGISSIAVANFLQECDKIHYKLRTLHIIRHGKAVVEAARYLDTKE